MDFLLYRCSISHIFIPVEPSALWPLALELPSYHWGRHPTTAKARRSADPRNPRLDVLLVLRQPLGHEFEVDHHNQGSTTTTAGSLPIDSAANSSLVGSDLTTVTSPRIFSWAFSSGFSCRGDSLILLTETSIMSFFTRLQQAWKNAIVKPSRSECHRWTPFVSNCVYFYSCFSHVADNLYKCPLFSVLIHVFIHYLPHGMMKNFCPFYFIILSLY